jgi:hypothetical protein
MSSPKPKSGNGSDAANIQPVKAQTKTDSVQFISKSTAKEAQHERAADLLSSGEKSTIELRRAGVMMPSVRIREMNELGYNIQRVALRDMYDEWGFLHPHVAVYKLISGPEVAA